MERKKKIIILIILIAILVSTFIIYMLNTKEREEIELNNLFLEEKSDEEKIEKEQKDNNIVKDEKEKIAIHIIGEIKKEGIIYLPKGSRIVDAIEKAGGSTKEADLTQINLAYILEDGQKIYIPNKKEKINEYIIKSNGNTFIQEGDKSQSILSKENDKVNINTATLNELDSLPGIGPSTAQKIIDYREKNGEFKKIEDLQNVKGIGNAKYEEVKDKITI